MTAAPVDSFSVFQLDEREVPCGFHQVVDEEPTLLRPLGVGGVVDVASLIRVRDRFGLRIALTGVMEIQDPRLPDLVLHTLFMKELVHAVGAPAVVLGNDGDGLGVRAGKYKIEITDLRLHLCDLLCLDGDLLGQTPVCFPLRFQSLKGGDGEVGIGDQIFHRIHAVLADAGEYI